MIDEVGDPKELEGIPAAHQEGVSRALARVNAAPGTVTFTPLGGGRSGALMYRVGTDRGNYVLRIVTQPNPLNQPARQFAIMQLAAGNGVAPQVFHADAVAGVVLTEWIASTPWQQALAAHPELAGEAGALLRRSQDGPAFMPFLDALQCIEQALLGLRGGGVTLPGALVQYLERFDAMCQVLRPHLVLAPSHNDVNPGNILFDGARLWLVDWETAWQNDPMFDVATMLHWTAFGPAERERFLVGYFGAPLSDLQAAKLLLMGQVVSCYYAVVFLLLAWQSGSVPEVDTAAEDLPSFDEMRRRLALDGSTLESAADRVRFSLVMVADAERRMTADQFTDAMTLLQSSATPQTSPSGHRAGDGR